MTLFPFFEDITGKTFLLIGGGRVAAGKLEKLLPFTDRIRIVAEEAPFLESFCADRGVPLGTDPEGDVRPVLLQRAFRDEDLDGADYVIGATDDRPLNRHVSELCRQKKLPVNIVDDAELCTFLFPSLVKRGDLVAGITTAGKSPGFGQFVRRTLDEALPENTEDIIDELYALKLQLKQDVPEQADRAKLLKQRLNELLENRD
ncbi:MAG: bifunctional precorrin-2 dehydrogenase/sirohydrochlorin ferrochelatase [Clostridia bacterium]|nr:bifunctional precorrin-2 dehydrogenase/sirohydrochlorin ferrochelatase [Clostridia bacterium]